MPERQQELRDKAIVITGASSGFGRGSALEFAKNGATLMLAARRDTLLEELARECESLGCRAIPVTLDVRHRDDMEVLAERAAGEFGRIDVWVNDAGVGALGRFDEIPIEDHVRVIETDLLGVLYGSYYAMKQFRRQGHGTLINIASLLGKVPSPIYSSYSAAKHGVVGLSAVIRQELRAEEIDEIRVCTVMPGEFHTPFFEHAANYTGHDLTPPPPFHDPYEVVRAVVSLATVPKDEVAVGSDARSAIVNHKIMPKTTERRMEREKAEMDESPYAPATTGSLYEPVTSGAGVVADKVGR